MRIRHALALAAIAAGLTACGTPTVTSTPDTAAQDVAAKEAAISAPSGAVTVGPSTQTATLGDAITLTGSDGRKLAIKVRKVFPAAKPVSEGISAGDGRKFYGVELAIKNIGTTAYDGTPASGSAVIDAEGRQFGTILADIKGGVSFNSVTIAPGDFRTGVIVFAVAEGAKIAKFQWALENDESDQTGEWTLSE